MDTDNMREAFEAIYKERYKDYWEAIDAVERMFKTQDEGQRYENMNVQDAWEFFQEITATSEKRIAALEASYKMRGKSHSPVIAALQADNKRLMSSLGSAIDRIEDMLKADDGQAWKEARKVLPRLKQVLAESLEDN